MHPIMHGDLSKHAFLVFVPYLQDNEPEISPTLCQKRKGPPSLPNVARSPNGNDGSGIGFFAVGQVPGTIRSKMSTCLTP